jgi:hypothetical protein
MSRVDVEQSVVIDRILSRLRSALSLNDRQCYQVINPLDPALPSGDFFVTVSPGAGSFPSGEQIPTNVTEEGSIVVTVYVRMRLDSAGHDDYALSDSQRGLYACKRKVMTALVGQDLQNLDGNTFLRQYLHILSNGRPDVDRKNGIAWWSFVFGTSWDWDLT